MTIHSRSLVSARDHWWTLDLANAFVSPGVNCRGELVRSPRAYARNGAPRHWLGDYNTRSAMNYRSHACRTNLYFLYFLYFLYKHYYINISRWSQNKPDDFIRPPRHFIYILLIYVIFNMCVANKSFIHFISKERLSKKQKRAQRVSQPQPELSQTDYLNLTFVWHHSKWWYWRTMLGKS
jgi:hypothetical protein